jgi:hypothetical protein
MVTATLEGSVTNVREAPTCETVTVTLPLTLVPVVPSAVAVRIAVPLATAVAKPDVLTVRTPKADEVHENVVAETAAPVEVLAVACSCTVASSEASEVTSTVATTALPPPPLSPPLSQRGPENVLRAPFATTRGNEE